jgi:hypothetical protein
MIEGLTNHQAKAGSIRVIEGVAEGCALGPDEASHDALVIAEKLETVIVSEVLKDLVS